MNCVLVLGLVVVSASLAASEDFYSSKYDGIDIDEILNNERLYKNYLSCVTARGKCSPDGKLLKDNIPDALTTGCSKFSPLQRSRANKILNHIMKKNPDDFDELKKLYDPEGKFEDVYKDGFKEE